METSIIIVNHQTRDFLRECLDSLDASSLPVNQEIIVVDNNSRDDSVDMVRERFPAVKVICLDENAGFSRANNIGIKNSLGKYLVLLNSDTKVSPWVISGMVDYLKENEDIGVLGCRQLGSRGDLQLSFGKFPTFKSEFIRKFLQARLSIDDPAIREYLENKYDGEVDVDWVSGSCMAIPRSVLEKSGLLDSNFFMYFEDIDLCRRIQETNRRICYNTGFTILHHGGVTARQNLARSYTEYRKSQFYFCRKYYGRAGLAALRALVFTKFLVLGLGQSIFMIANAWDRKKRYKTYSKLMLCKKMMGLAIRGRTVF